MRTNALVFQFLSVLRIWYSFVAPNTVFYGCSGNTPYRWVACGDPKFLYKFLCVWRALAHAKHTKTCIKGLFAAKPQHDVGIAPIVYGTYRSPNDALA